VAAELSAWPELTSGGGPSSHRHWRRRRLRRRRHQAASTATNKAFCMQMARVRSVPCRRRPERARHIRHGGSLLRGTRLEPNKQRYTTDTSRQVAAVVAMVVCQLAGATKCHIVPRRSSSLAEHNKPAAHSASLPSGLAFRRRQHWRGETTISYSSSELVYWANTAYTFLQKEDGALARPPPLPHERRRRRRCQWDLVWLSSSSLVLVEW
jgi:hypothetical protein